MSLKKRIILLGLAMIGIVSAGAQDNGLSLDLKFDGIKTVNASGETIKIDGTFANAPDGKKGLAIGSTQKTPHFPANKLIGENGTILFSFMSKKKEKPSTILCWRNILSLRGASGDCSIIFYQLAGIETLFFAFKKPSEPDAFGSRQPIEFNRWYQVGCTWDGKNVRYFIDGVLQKEFAQPNGVNFANWSHLYFGPFIDGSSNPESWGEDSCLISDLKVYRKALTPEEIMAASGIKAVDASQQFKTLLAVPQIQTPPVMDGKLDDNAWQRASSLITLIDGPKPSESFSYNENNPKFCHDGKNLFIGFKAVFPSNYKIIKGELRGAKEPEMWSTESFEFWVDINGKLYNFGGNVAGGYSESIHPNSSWNGEWQYKTTLSVRIDDCQVWQGEISIPFETLGITAPLGKDLKVNFCRTWCSLGRLGVTSFGGVDDYLKKELFATISIGDATAFQEIAINNPNYGNLEQKLQISSDKKANLEYSVKLLSSIGVSPELSLVNKMIQVNAGSIERFDIQAKIESSSYDRILFQLKDTAKSIMLVQQVVPFKLVESYLEVVPLFSSSKILVKPNYTLAKSKAGNGQILVKLINPDKKVVFSKELTSNDELTIPFQRDHQSGVYLAEIYAAIAGTEKMISSTSFPYSGVSPWEKPLLEERVLPPFEPLKVIGADADFNIDMWGRSYQYKKSLFPKTITALKQPVLTATALYINGTEMQIPLKVIKSAPHRVELTGSANSSNYELSQNSWIEYDGVLWNSIKIKAKQNLAEIKFTMDVPAAMAKFFHATGGGFGLGGRRTEPVDKDVAMKFWPIVWIGSQEQGICWFAESDATWKTSDATPIRIIKKNQQTTLEIIFADKLSKDQEIVLEFGLIATPVKPLPKNYPFTMFADEWSVPLNRPAPRAPVTAVGLLNIYDEVGLGFYDLPYGAPKPNAQMKQFIKELAAFEKKNAIGIPCHAAIMIPEEYPQVKENIQEWQKLPADHYPYKKADSKDYLWYNLCPASMAANYYVYRFKELIKNTNVKGEYFDFGNAFPCSNKYHGCNGNYTFLAKREFYKRMAGALADAHNGEYTIVAHNSEAVQIPIFTFVTHFLNGEGLRQMSSSVFHGGKDLLDTYTIADFASEHSSLPWGITSSIYVPTDPLLPQFGGEKAGMSSPQELYRFRMTKAVMAGSLIHNTISSQARQHFGWFDKVIRFYDDFKVPQAEFMPYWRNSEYVKVLKGKDIYVSFYRHHDNKELLAVISHVSKEHLDQEVVIEFNLDKLGFKKLNSANELLTGPDPEYQSLYAEKNRMRNPVELGDFGVEFKGLENNRIKLNLKHHSVAIVRIGAE